MRAGRGLAALTVASVLLTVCAAAYAQGSSSELPDPVEVVTEPGLRFNRVGQEEGLPQSHVMGVAQDSVGFLWFGTQEGLARYDGYGSRMKVFRAGDSGLGGSYITTVLNDSTGRVWAGTDNGLFRYDPGSAKFEDLNALLGSPEVPTIAALKSDTKGNVWVGMGNGELYLVDAKDQARAIQFGSKTKSEEDEIVGLSGDASGSMWLATRATGLFEIASDGTVVRVLRTASRKDLAGAGNMNTILRTEHGLWLGADKGLLLFDPKSEKIVKTYTASDSLNSISDSRVSALLLDSSGVLWVGTRNGLNRMDIASGVFDRFFADMSNPQALSFPWITSLFQDSGGVIWVGTFAGGLVYFDELRTHFRYYLARATSVTAFYEDKDETLWVGTYPASLARFDRKAKKARLWEAFKTDEFEQDLRPYWLNSIIPDATVPGVLWLSLYELGIIAFRASDESFELFAPSTGAPDLSKTWQLSQGADGTVYAATLGAGLAYLPPASDQWQMYNSETVPGMSDLLYAVAPDRQQEHFLWIGSADNGLLRFDLRDKTVVAFNTSAGKATSISHDSVTSIATNQEGILWLGTYGGGLNRFTIASESFERFGAKEGLGNESIYGVVVGGDGRVWVSTNGAGLAAFDPKTSRFESFGASDGALAEYAQASYHLGHSGSVYFGGPGGFFDLRPKEIGTDQFVPPVVLSGFDIFGKEASLSSPIWATDGVDLSHGDAVLSIRFAALAYANPARNRFKYKLEGLHDWIETSDPDVSYTNLSAGDYVFHVKGANRHGVWNEEGSTLRIHVAPPWYRTWWAYGAYGLLALGVVLAFVRYQTSRVRREQQANNLAALERELELTGAVQTGFLPKEPSIVAPPVELEGYYRPASQCGGDWWWHEYWAKKDMHFVAVGDVTGHGPGPAMVTAAVAAASRTHSDLGLELDPLERLRLLNQEVLRAGQGSYQMTMTALTLDTRTGALRVYSAGGPPVISLTGQRTNVIPVSGTPLGTEAESFHTGASELSVTSGQRLVLYTDGIPECVLPNGRQLGLRRFVNSLKTTVSMPLPAAVQQLIQVTDDVRAKEPQDDDWTLVMLEWGGNV